MINCPGDQLLARPAFSPHQHRHVLRGHPADGLVNVLHRRAVADHAVGPIVDGHAAGNRHRHAHQAADFQRLADQLLQRVDGQRLEHEIVRSQRHGLDCRVTGIHGRDEDHGHFRIEGVELMKRLQPGKLGKHDVQQHHVGLRLAQQLQPVVDGRRLDHVHVATAQRFAHQVSHGPVVIDDQNRWHDSPAGVRRRADTRLPKKALFLIQAPEPSV